MRAAQNGPRVVLDADARALQLMDADQAKPGRRRERSGVHHAVRGGTKGVRAHPLRLRVRLRSAEDDDPTDERRRQGQRISGVLFSRGC